MLFIVLVYLLLLGNVVWTIQILNYKHFKIKDIVFLVENNLTGRKSSVMGDTYVISDENKKDIVYWC